MIVIYFHINFLFLILVTNSSFAEDDSSDNQTKADCSFEEICEMFDACSYFLVDRLFNVTTIKCDYNRLDTYDEMYFSNDVDDLFSKVKEYLEDNTCFEKDTMIDLYYDLLNSENVTPSLSKTKYIFDTDKGVGIVAKRDLPEGFHLNELNFIFLPPLDEEDPVYETANPFIYEELGLGTITYLNHHCDHNAILRISKSEVRIETIVPIKKGEEIFIYYSDYFDEDFNCQCELCEEERAREKFKIIHDIRSACSLSDMSHMHDIASLYLIDTYLNVFTIKNNPNIIKDTVSNDIDFLYQKAFEAVEHIDSCINKEYFLELSVFLLNSEYVTIIPSSEYSKNNTLGVTVIAKTDIPKETEITELAGMFSELPNEDESLDGSRYNKHFILRHNRLLVGPVSFIHHRCIPNARIDNYKWLYSIITTTKYIKKDEIITVDYGQYKVMEGECQCDVCKKLRTVKDFQDEL